MDTKSELKTKLFSVYKELYASPSDTTLQQTFFDVAEEIAMLSDEKRQPIHLSNPNPSSIGAPIGPPTSVKYKLPETVIKMLQNRISKSRPFAASTEYKKQVTIGKSKFFELHEKKVTIGTYTFTVVSKKTTSLRNIVLIQCTDGKTENEFHVYASISELMTWRLCYKTGEGHIYKGDFNYKHYDYVQQTLIHVDLQKCIHRAFDFLKDDPSIDCEMLYKGDTRQNDEVDSMFRPKLVEPFNQFARKQYTLPKLTDEKKYVGRVNNEDANVCGSRWLEEKHTKELDELSKKIEEKFKVKSVSFRYNVHKRIPADNSNTMFYFNYNVYVATLVSKEKRPLYMVYVKVNYFKSLMGDDSGQIEKENVYFPVGLTMTQSCNKFGCYTDYVPAGRYICKFLEYYSQLNVRDNDKFPAVSMPENFTDLEFYQYMADIYQPLFPFSYLRENPTLEATEE